MMIVKFVWAFWTQT